MFSTSFSLVKIITIKMTMMMVDADTGARGQSCHSRVWNESVAQDSVRSVRSKRRIQARSYC